MKWNFDLYPHVEAALNNQGRLILRKPGNNAVEKNIFTKGQEMSLWNTIVESGLDCDSSCVTLFNGFDETREHKPYTAEPAAILNSNGNNKAYEAWQIAAFKPVHVELRVNHGSPQLCAMAILKPETGGKKAKVQAPVLSLKRVGDKGEALKPQGPAKKLTRAE